ncbi:hypothetical protein H4R21_001749 [Coemansia helicoidea]|uniref:Uncharacterized protein n=1 Tax=Coemansia helicoidea TaxID=1286919 RepID=A0ACC1LAS2_9FUNG|nr:hypothetical protein H4R21_001749 [Coemansia helicoidea]
MGEDQTGFIAGRSIFDNVHTVHLAIKCGQLDPDDCHGALVFLDQPKALDREWRPTLKHAYIQLKGMPPPRNLSQKRILEEELPQPYRVLNPFSPYTHYRTHKRLTIYVDKNGIFEDAECS